MAVGRLEKVRCFDTLLYSIFFINKEFLRGWKVLIVGDGNEKNYLNQLLQKLSLHDIVQLIGTIKDIERYYSKASISRPVRSTSIDFVNLTAPDNLISSISKSTIFRISSIDGN
jgi:Glycosyl transferases group 1.